MDLEEFLEHWSDDDDTNDEAVPTNDNEDEDSEVEEEDSENEASESDESSESVASDEEKLSGARDQKKYLASLKDKDPEFYKFLEENDQELLNFDESSSSEDDDDGDNTEDRLHKPPETLEVASDDSDFEVEKDNDDLPSESGKLTRSMIDKWSERIEKSPNPSVISELVLAFRSAIGTLGQGATGEDLDDGLPSSKQGQKGKNLKKPAKVLKSKYKITATGGMFNVLVKVCLEKMEPALAKLLSIDEGKKKNKVDPQKSKNWKPLNKWLKAYTSDLAKLLSSLSEPSVISSLLKHIHGLVPYYGCLPKSAKSLLKTLIILWSTHADEPVRVLSFMVIVKLIRNTKDVNEGKTEDGLDEDRSLPMLELCIKGMYMAYIRNSKFTSPNTWPVIHFMRRSLSEVFLLDAALAYRHAFIYIRQLTIHLRNAIMHTNEGASSAGILGDGKKNKKSKKTDNPLQTVYNWQFVHSIHLWVQMLTDSFPSEVLEPLIYPLVQLVTGTIKLNYTAKFYPLRFHLAKLLTDLSLKVGKFIPILPFYLDILNSPAILGSKKSSKLTMKPMDFQCVIKLSKSQLSENGFKDATVDEVYSGLMKSLAALSHKISFPELVVPAVGQIRKFVKKCRVPNYSKKLKTVMTKITENTNFILEKRSHVRFGIQDLEQVRAWEAQIMASGTPLINWYDTFRSVKEAEHKKKKQKELDDYKFIPKMKLKKGDKAPEEFKGLFGDDDDNDSDDLDDVERFELKEERGKKRKKPAGDCEEEIEAEPEPESSPKKSAKKDTPDDSSEEEDEEDIVEDFNFSDDDAGEAEDLPSEDNSKSEEDDESSADTSDDSDGGESNSSDSDGHS